MSTQSTNAKTGNPFLRFLKERWIAIILTILAIAFIVQNHRTVSIDLFWMRVHFPLWATLAIVFLLGALVAWLVGRRSRKNRNN
jgi:putative membrane protein